MKLEFIVSFLNVQEVKTLRTIKEVLEGISGIYMIKCLVTGTVYIGSAVNLYRRLNEHRLGHQSNTHLQNAIASYGLSSFEFGVLLFCDTAELTLQEQLYLDLLFKLDASLRYNFLPMAGNSQGYFLSDEAKVKISLAKIGNTCRSVPVSLLNLDRTVYKIFPSIKTVAIYLGASKTTVRKYFTTGEVFKGLYYIVRKVV